MRREIRIRQKRIVVLFLIMALLWNHLTPMVIKATDATSETGSDSTSSDMQSISSIETETLLQPNDTFDSSDRTYDIYYYDVDGKSIINSTATNDNTYAVLTYSVDDLSGGTNTGITLQLSENDIFYGWIVSEKVHDSAGEVTGINLQAVQGYEINYELNGGTNAETNPTTYGKGIGVTEFADPTKTGYTFEGWYTNLDDDTTKVTEITKTQTDDIKLYAKWTEIVDEPETDTPQEPGVSTPLEPVPGTPEGETPSIESVAIPNGGTLQLKAGTAYTLGSGSWKITGDDTVYAGGITFYVAEDAEYEFIKQ